MNHEADVLVVGGGPAGAAAAIELRRAGRSVLVVDKAVFPRDKCCGDGLTTLALRELEQLGLDPVDVDDWFDVDAAWLRSPSGREITVPLPDGGLYAAVAPRMSFDAALLDVARKEGAVVRDGHAFQGLESKTDRVVVDVDGLGTVSCRYVIAADGMWSPVRKAVGATLPDYRGEWHAFRQYARNVTGPAAERLIVWFEADLLPGYAWSFPLPGDRVNIGFGVLRDGERRTRDMAQLWRDLLARDHVVDALGANFELEGRHTAWPIPARVDEIALTSGRVLFVGDAAAATDVMTGEGIGQALLTGRLAATAIAEAGALRPERAARRFERDVRHHLAADHRMSKRLGRVLAHERGARGALRIVELSGEWGKRNFARWMFEDEPRDRHVTAPLASGLPRSTGRLSAPMSQRLRARISPLSLIALAFVLATFVHLMVVFDHRDDVAYISVGGRKASAVAAECETEVAPVVDGGEPWTFDAIECRPSLDAGLFCRDALEEVHRYPTTGRWSPLFNPASGILPYLIAMTTGATLLAGAHTWWRRRSDARSHRATTTDDRPVDAQI